MHPHASLIIANSGALSNRQKDEEKYLVSRYLAEARLDSGVAGRLLEYGDVRRRNAQARVTLRLSDAWLRRVFMAAVVLHGSSGLAAAEDALFCSSKLHAVSNDTPIQAVHRSISVVEAKHLRIVRRLFCGRFP